MPSFGDQSWWPSVVVARVSSIRCDFRRSRERRKSRRAGGRAQHGWDADSFG